MVNKKIVLVYNSHINGHIFIAIFVILEDDVKLKLIFSMYYALH